MEIMLLSPRGSSLQNVKSGEDQEEMAVFAG